MLKQGTISILGALLLAAASPICAYAQDDTRQFSAKSGEVVNEAMTLATDGQNQAAVTLLQGILSTPDLNAYERSTIYQMLGQYSYELGRADEAQAAFENALTAGGLLTDETENIKVVIAQLMIGNGQYRDGAERLEAYLNAGGPFKPQYVDLLVNAWVQAEDFNRALPWAEKWFESASPKERRHFDLLNFLYNNLNLPDRQADIVKQMIDRWPEDKELRKN